MLFAKQFLIEKLPLNSQGMYTRAKQINPFALIFTAKFITVFTALSKAIPCTHTHIIPRTIIANSTVFLPSQTHRITNVKTPTLQSPKVPPLSIPYLPAPNKKPAPAMHYFPRALTKPSPSVDARWQQTNTHSSPRKNTVKRLQHHTTATGFPRAIPILYKPISGLHSLSI